MPSGRPNPERLETEESTMKADIGRIQKMEALLNRCTAASARLDQSLEEMDALRKDTIRLFRYYGSEAWHADREADLPEGVSAGVLSEDAAYDAITALRDSAFHMLKLATDILEKWI